MAVTLTAEQRNALRDQVIDRLSGIGDVQLCVQAGDYRGAERLGREYADDLRFLNEDLGWEEDPSRETYELTLPPGLLKRALSRHCHDALMNEAGEAAERADLRRNQEVNQFLVQTCSRLLAQIEAESPS